jgi:hypothetical protein
VENNNIGEGRMIFNDEFLIFNGHSDAASEWPLKIIEIHSDHKGCAAH